MATVLGVFLIVGACGGDSAPTMDARVDARPARDATVPRDAIGDAPFDAATTPDALDEAVVAVDVMAPPDAAPPRPIDEARVVTFDGVDDYQSLGRSPRLLFSRGESISISVWVRPRSLRGYNPIVGRPAPCGNAGNFLLDAIGGTPRFCYVDTADASHCASLGSTPLPLETWTHVALRYTYGDPASFRGYVDGALVNDGTFGVGSGAADPYARPRHVIHAGHFAGCGSGAEYFFDGSLYDLAVYDRALSDGEVAAHATRATVLPCTDGAERAGEVELTVVDPAATGYATFSSHNQRIVETPHGLFTGYLLSRNEAFTAQRWRFLRSTDGGRAFAVLHDEVSATEPPIIDADGDGNVYVMIQNLDHPMGLDGPATLYTFRPTDNFASHTEVDVPGANSGKAAMRYDPVRDVLYYFSHAGRFLEIGLDGVVRHTTQLITSGPNAGPQYPHLALGDDGTIYGAWTSLRHGEYLYWSIHAARSADGGRTWTRLDGTPLALPIVCDDTGPADEVTAAAEHGVHTWLWNVVAKDGSVHFAYQAQHPTGATQNYVRRDARTGVETLRTAPRVGGTNVALNLLDGFPVSDPGSPRRFFYASRAVAGGVGVIQTQDNGTRWLDVARGDGDTSNHYGFAGGLEVTDSGYVIGMFTDAQPKPATPRAIFFRSRVRGPNDPIACM